MILFLLLMALPLPGLSQDQKDAASAAFLRDLDSTKPLRIGNRDYHDSEYKQVTVQSQGSYDNVLQIIQAPAEYLRWTPDKNTVVRRIEVSVNCIRAGASISFNRWQLFLEVAAGEGITGPAPGMEVNGLTVINPNVLSWQGAPDDSVRDLQNCEVFLFANTTYIIQVAAEGNFLAGDAASISYNIFYKQL